MATREYDKAFEFLTQSLKDSTNDQRARLVITFIHDLCPQILYLCNGHYWYFLDNYGNNSRGNLIVDPRIRYKSRYNFYSVGHVMKGFTKEDFIKMWIDNAIGADLYVNSGDVYRKTSKFLDKNDTVESLCVQYDMTQV